MKTLLFFCFFASTALNAASTQNEMFEKSWTLQYKKSDDQEKIYDWVLKEGNQEEGASFTTQYYQLNEPYTLNQIFDKFVSTLKEYVEPPELLKVQVLSQDESSIFFEWNVPQPYKDANHEWVKMSSDGSSLSIVRYNRKAPYALKDEAMWIQCVESIDPQTLSEESEEVSG